MMYSQARSHVSLVESVSIVQAFLYARVYGQKYVTLVALHYKQNGEVELVNGGHVSPLLILKDGSIRPILGGDVPVGLLEDATYHSIRFTLPLGARLVLLSDGVTEAENSLGVQFGSIERQHELSAPDPIPAVFAAMFRFCESAPTHDDCTLLVIDRTA